MDRETNRTLLLVEDEAIIAKYEAMMLQRYGYRVITAFRGAEAVQIAVANPDIELILMDINLSGGMDGPEAAEAILKQRDLPVVFLSGHTEDEVVERTEGIASYGYVLKSLPETVIITSIKMAFRLYEARKQEKEKEARLREQDALYRGILRTTLDGFWIANLQGDLLEINETYCQMSGYTREELLAMKISDLDVIEDPEQVAEHICKIVKNRQDRFETRHRRKDGSSYPVEASIQYRPEMGERTIGFFRDITTRQQAEETLRASQERYRHISNITSDITYSCNWLTDGGYSIDWISGAVEKITGYTNNEMVALGCWGKVVIDEDFHLFEKNVLDLLPGEQGQCELRIRSKDGEIRWLISKAECTGDGVGLSAHRLFGGLVDISARKTVDAELAQTYQEKRHLLTELQHRAKNSFAMITSMIGLMINSAQDEAAKKALSELDPRVRAMAELYDLLYTTNSNHDVKLDDYAARISESIVGIEPVNLVQSYEEITVSSSVAAPVGLILTELLTNAVKYAFPEHKGGSISVEVARSAVGARVRVVDDGVGLPVDFNRQNRSSLGLLLIEILNNQIHGQFTIENGAERGTVCVVEFPLES